MVTENKALKISPYSQGQLLKYVQNVSYLTLNNTAWRAQLFERDRIYQRETDRSLAQVRAARANQTGNASAITNVTMPVVMPQVEAAHGFLMNTFCSSYPIFPVNSGPQYEDVAKQIDAIMGESATRFQYARHMGMAFRDGLKYNFMALEVEWKNLKVYSVKQDTTQDVVFGTPVETEFSGNILKRIDPYNIIIDDRCLPSEAHEKADFIGYTELMSYIQLKNLFLELDNTLTMNADAAFDSNGTVSAAVGAGSPTGSYYIPQVNPNALRNPNMTGTNWLAYAGLDANNNIKRADMYEVTTLYMRIIPREMGINTGKDGGQNGIPQIFKTITINQKVVIYVERKSNAHNYIPILIGQPIEDGLGYQTKSMADNAAPYQNLASALYNSALASQRRKVYDRMFYDPSRVNKADIDKVDPVARIAVKTEAYGKPISDAIYQVPFRDEGVPMILGTAREVTEMADVSSGQNRVQRGQFQKGNKTESEFNTVMDKSDLRPQTMAVVLESGWIQPIKYILKMNILQYQPPADLYNQQTQTPVKINPSDLRKVAWQFQVADGVLPVSAQFNTEQFGQVLQMVSAAPALASGYDIIGMFFYQMKLGGATWVDAFKLQPQQQAQQAAAIAGPQTVSTSPNGSESTTPAVPAATAGQPPTVQ